MKYLMLPGPARDALLADLGSMADFLAERFAMLSADEARVPGRDGILSPVEQCWHLADLEREGFGARIERLRTEAEPRLPDFDGGRIVAERCYAARELDAGLEAFREARRVNLAALAGLRGDDWLRAGTQEGVGRVHLCDLPAIMMAEHDASHRAEIEGWCRGER